MNAVHSFVLALGLALPVAALSAEIRVMCYSDGNECEVTRDLAKRFESRNAGSKVVVDQVPYKAIVERPTFFEFADDRACWDDNDEMLVGPDLLVAPVFEPGARERCLYLPRDASTPGWYEYDTGVWHDAGQSITVAASIDRLPLFVRAGAVIPMIGGDDFTRRTDEPSRALLMFPVPNGIDAAARPSRWVEDDGLTEAWRDGAFMLAELRVDATDDRLRLSVRRLDGRGTFVEGAVGVRVPESERRTLTMHCDGLDLALERA